MNKETLEQIGELLTESFNRSRSVNFKSDKAQDSFVKRFVDKLSELEPAEIEEEVETFKVGRIEVTKVGEKSTTPKVVTAGDSAKGDEHSDKFHGRKAKDFGTEST